MHQLATGISSGMLHKTAWCCADADAERRQKKRRKAGTEVEDLERLEAEIEGLDAAAAAQVWPAAASALIRLTRSLIDISIVSQPCGHGCSLCSENRHHLAALRHERSWEDGLA